MAPFLIQELKMVRHTQVSCRPATPRPRRPPELRDGERKRGISASGQRDFLVFKTSRSKTLPFIEGGAGIYRRPPVHLSRPAVKGGEIISVRGLGKFRYTGAGNQTKKGRLSSMPKIYIVRKYMPKVTIRFRAVKLRDFHSKYE